MAGRKAIEWTEEQQDQFKSLCKIFCSEQEICEVMGISDKTLTRLINKYFHKDIAPNRPASEKVSFAEAFDYFSAGGRASLRRKQYELAMSGDRQMLIWLGKQYLGQGDGKGGERPSEGRLDAIRTKTPGFKAVV